MTEQQNITGVSANIPRIESCAFGDEISGTATSKEMETGKARRFCNFGGMISTFKISVVNGRCKATCLNKDCFHNLNR